MPRLYPEPLHDESGEVPNEPSRESGPHAVLCPNHGRVFLTKEEYMAQMYQADSLWKCPICPSLAAWDEDTYEASLELEDSDRDESETVED